jgi:hypothetical protein
MASNVSHRASIIRGLPFLFVSVLAGCSGGPSEEAGTTSGAVQQEQGWGPKFCGGKDMKECASTDVCLPFMARGCAGPGNIGICIPRPPHCPTVSDPVCGCDGTTYTNLCEAVHAGTTTEHDGACTTEQTCNAHTPCPGEGVCAGDHGGPAHFPIPWAFDPFERHDGSSTCECPATHQCATGEKWNASPNVCACETTADPCTGVTCKAGDVCAAGACEPNPCATVSCKASDVCIVQMDGTAACEADPCATTTCKAGQSCVIQVGGAAICE